MKKLPMANLTKQILQQGLYTQQNLFQNCSAFAADYFIYFFNFSLQLFYQELFVTISMGIIEL